MSMRNTGFPGLEDYELSCLCMTSSESTVVKRQWSMIISEHGDPYGNLLSLEAYIRFIQASILSQQRSGGIS